MCVSYKKITKSNLVWLEHWLSLNLSLPSSNAFKIGPKNQVIVEDTSILKYHKLHKIYSNWIFIFSVNITIAAEVGWSTDSCCHYTPSSLARRHCSLLSPVPSHLTFRKKMQIWSFWQESVAFRHPWHCVSWSSKNSSGITVHHCEQLDLAVL